MKNEYDTCTYFEAPDAHFDYLSFFNGTQAKQVQNLRKKHENCLGAEKTNTVLHVRK
jgi:hypothetical protein